MCEADKIIDGKLVCGMESAQAKENNSIRNQQIDNIKMNKQPSFSAREAFDLEKEAEKTMFSIIGAVALKTYTKFEKPEKWDDASAYIKAFGRRCADEALEKAIYQINAHVYKSQLSVIPAELERKLMALKSTAKDDED